jgi:hypothetical protein
MKWKFNVRHNLPPQSLALRGDLDGWLGADASIGANKIGVWGLRPQRGPGAEPLAFLEPPPIFKAGTGRDNPEG